MSFNEKEKKISLIMNKIFTRALTTSKKMTTNMT